MKFCIQKIIKYIDKQSTLAIKDIGNMVYRYYRWNGNGTKLKNL